MDFSIIEGLTDEELRELYNYYVSKDLDTENVSGCLCKSKTDRRIWVDFGCHQFGGYVCDQNGHGGCGYCEMLYVVGSTYESCSNWCLANGFVIGDHNTTCMCNKKGYNYYVTWYTCSR